MRTIQVDDDIYEFLEQRVRGFNDSPTSVLRRELKLEKSAAESASDKHVVVRKIEAHGKRPKASLQQLIEVGSLKEGQTLYMRNYQGKQIKDSEATIEGDKLRQNGRIQSMSPLAAKHLKKLGYQGGAVRGPSFWFTSNGRSITELWDEYLGAGVERA